MKAFVTGATGFIGSHLVDRLLEKGFEVYCLRRSTSNTRWLDGKNVQYVNGDLYSNDVLGETIKDMDYIFHVAGILKAKKREEYEKANNLATKNLIEITHKVNPNLKKFVHISSQIVCGPTPDEKPLDEKSPPNPMTNYAITKLKAEQEVIKYKDKFPVTVIRPPAVFGPRDTEILVYFQTFSKGLNSVIGLKEKYLNLIYIEDLIDGIMLATEKENNSGEIYFICSDKAYDWNEIGSITSNILGKKAIKIKIPHSVVYGVGYAAQFFLIFSKKAATLNVEKCKDLTRERWVCSNQKAKDELGFREKYTLEESFRKTIDWYKKKNWIKA